MKYSIAIVITSLLLIGVWYTMSGDDSNQVRQVESGNLSVATSFYPLEFALERIMGDLGTVTNIGEGKDPHDFEPTTQNILTLQRADLVVLQGADFEPWGDDVMARLEADNVPVVIATADIDLHESGDGHEDHEEEHEEAMHEHEDHDDHEHEDEEHGKDKEIHDHEEHGEESDEHDEDEDNHEHSHGAFNPHTWVDPVLFSQSVEHIAHEIAAIDPANADTYRANAAALMAELAVIDTAYKNQLANCELGEVITSHEAFTYVGERYDFEIHSIAGLSTQDTPSVTTLAELKEEAEEGIKAILLEENSVAAYGETLARETGLNTLSINPIAYIIPKGENYLTLMQSNLNAFAAALNCNG